MFKTNSEMVGETRLKNVDYLVSQLQCTLYRNLLNIQKTESS